MGGRVGKDQHKGDPMSTWSKILSGMKSDVLYLLKYDDKLGPKRGLAYARLLANLEVLEGAERGEDKDDDSETKASVDSLHGDD